METARNVAIVGIGWSGFAPTTPSVSYKELMFEAATRAYADANLDPRRDVQAWVCVSEDYWEGTSIFDEYVPDQLGAAQRPVHTITGEGIQGLLAAVMQIQTGRFDVVAVEAHSKASNVVHPDRVVAFGMDPIYTRPLAHHPSFVAGLEMRRYLHDTQQTREQCASVVVKNRRAALRNPAAAYPAALSTDDVLSADVLADPLSILDASPLADGCIVMVLASADRARGLSQQPIWLAGGAWYTDTPWLETRDWSHASYAQLVAERMYRQAGIGEPRSEIDFAEIDDTYSYKELQHLEALGLARRGEAGRDVISGRFQADGELPVNVSGGSLGMGHLLDASGLARVVEVVLQLRGEAGPRQLPNVRTGLAFGWRGVPTTTGAGVVLRADAPTRGNGHVGRLQNTRE